MSRPGSPHIPCDSRRGQLAHRASCLRQLTINIPNGNTSDMRWRRGPRPTPCRPAGLRVPAHTHDNLYPSTSSTQTASTPDEESLSSRSTRRVEVDQNSWKSLAHCGLAADVNPTGPRIPARAYFTFTFLLSRTYDITVKLQGEMEVTQAIASPQTTKMPRTRTCWLRASAAMSWGD